MSTNSFGSRATLNVGGTDLTLFRLDALDKARVGHVQKLPFSTRVLLENLLRNEDGRQVTREDIEAVANWDPKAKPSHEIAFRPSRVLLQDFTGVPAVVDLAAMRDAIVELGGQASQINPLDPADLVIDHSVQVDRFGSKAAFAYNAKMENERNKERYAFLRWGQTAFDNFTVVPPDTGIVHQVNLEYLAKVLFTRKNGDALVAYPDSLVGTDSHSTMINGLGVVGWGVGGIEAEAAMLGQPIAMLVPQVVGFKLTGRLSEGVTATDLVLTVVQMLRAHGVVGKFVEFFGPGLSTLPLADRATIANMGPEYGATIGYFPVDAETLAYLRFSGRPEALVQQVEAYYKEQGLFRTDSSPDPEFSSTLELDLSTVEASIAGPKRPQDRIALRASKPSWRKILTNLLGKEISSEQRDELAGWAEGTQDAPESVEAVHRSVEVNHAGQNFELDHGKVVIAAITSCTNTSNPSVMLAAGLVAKNAVERGLNVKPWVKTSLAPGSMVVTDYLTKAGLIPYLEALNFHLVGYGCTTCIGNSGPLPGPISKGVNDADLVACSVLSGNRNFEGRIGPDIRANFLASPPLVVAYAIAGTLDIDVYNEPLGYDPNGDAVFLKDIWPSSADVAATVRDALQPEQFKEQYSNVYEGDEVWKNLEIPQGERFEWSSDSTYIQQPPFFMGMSKEVPELSDIQGARLLALLGDSITTDHISPAGSIATDSPAGKYLTEHGVERQYFNSYGSRRGNHEVMMRGTFANVRLRNQLAPGTEGGFTKKLPEGEVTTIYEAAMAYRDEGTPVIVIGGKEYGSGSSRDWAAKGPSLLGVKAVIAESFERIRRSNCIGMGILPLQFKSGESAKSLGITGTETFSITGIADGLAPGATITVKATAEDGTEKTFETIARTDTPVEVDYYRNGGILQYVLRNMIGSA